MELDEILQRVVRRYGVLLAVLIVVPVTGVLLLVSRMPVSYLSTARVQLIAKTPDTSAAADAVVSQARALVTSRAVVERAVHDGGAPRDVNDVIANRVTVTGLGASSTVDVSVEDDDPRVAQRITTSLVGQLVDVTNQLRLGNLPDGLKSIDDQLTDLASKRAPIAAEAQANPHDAVAQNRLAGIDRLISDLSASRNDLALQSATAGRASVIDPAPLPLQAQPDRLAQIGFLAAVGAVVLGLLVVAVVETLRPHVSGLPRIGRMLQAPSLGAVAVGGHVLQLGPGLVQRLRLAARRSGSTIVVVVAAGRVPHLEHIVTVLDGRLGARADAPEGEDAAADDDPADVVGHPAAPAAGHEPAAPSTPAANGSGPQRAAGDVVLVAERPPEPAAVSANGAGTAALHRPSYEGIQLVTTLDRLGPAQEGLAVAVLVLTPTVAQRSGLDEVRELLEISGWPLLGVTAVTRRRRLRQPR